MRPVHCRSLPLNQTGNILPKGVGCPHGDLQGRALRESLLPLTTVDTAPLPHQLDGKSRLVLDPHREDADSGYLELPLAFALAQVLVPEPD